MYLHFSKKIHLSDQLQKDIGTCYLACTSKEKSPRAAVSTSSSPTYPF